MTEKTECSAERARRGTSPRPDWMIVEQGHEARVVARFGNVPYQVGDTLPQTPKAEDREEVCLNGMSWIVFPCFAAATDCLWLVRLPLSDTRLRQVEECLPRQVDFEEEEEELLRLLRAVHRLCGISLRKLGERVPPMPESGIARAPVNTVLFVAMLLLLVGVFADHGLARSQAILYRVHEGIALRLILPCSIGAEHLPSCETVSLCRQWAEARGQLFSFRYEAKQLHLSICVVNKEFSLLGIKTEGPLTEDI